MNTKILILAANPIDTKRLRLRKEVDKIREGLNRGKNRDQFDIVVEWAANTEHLSSALNNHKPQIVHFCDNLCEF